MSPLLSRRLLSAQSDERLVALARAGHERAFEILVQRYRGPLLRYCERLLLPASRADDAVQQAWVSAWQALSRGVAVHEPRAWLYRIVHNEAVSALRRSGYDYAELHESLSGATSPAEDLERRIAVREALAGLASLPEVQREVLLRTAVEGQSHEEVATALGLSDGAVRGLIYRARGKMRSAATALTPSPVAVWAASVEKTALLSGRVAEGLGLGSLGASGAMVKAGVVALTAGGLVTGGVLSQTHPHHSRPARAGIAADRNPRRSVTSRQLPVDPRGGSPQAGQPGTLAGRTHPGSVRRRPRRAGHELAADRRGGSGRHRDGAPAGGGPGTTTRLPARSPGGLDPSRTGPGHGGGGGGHQAEGPGSGRDGGGSSPDASSGGRGPDHGSSGSGPAPGSSGVSGSGSGSSGGGDGSGNGPSGGELSGQTPVSAPDGGGSGGGGGRDASTGSGPGPSSSSSGSNGGRSPRTDGSGSPGSGSSTPGN